MKAQRSELVYLSRINRVIDYISAHLADPLPLEKLARLAHFSPFHFHRIFRSSPASRCMRSCAGCDSNGPCSRWRTVPRPR